MGPTTQPCVSENIQAIFGEWVRAVIESTRPINCTWLKEDFLIVRIFSVLLHPSVVPISITRVGRFERSFPFKHSQSNPVNGKWVVLHLTTQCQEVTMLLYKRSTQPSLRSPFQHPSQIQNHGLQHLKAELTVPDSQSAWLGDHYLGMLIRRSFRWFSVIVQTPFSSIWKTGHGGQNLFKSM